MADGYPELPKSAVAAFRWRGLLCWMDESGLWLTLPEDREASRTLNLLHEIHELGKALGASPLYDPHPASTRVRFIADVVGASDVWVADQPSPPAGAVE